jgi:glycosyltransferase involved in cell wall biosynthesis
MQAPTISIVLPHYNDGAALEAMLRSIVAQRVRPHEVVIADDASDLPIAPAVHALCEQHPRIRLLRFDENVGAVANMNRAIAHATGRILVPRSANDLLAPHYLERLAAAAARFTDAPMFVSSVTYFATSPRHGSLEDLGWGDDVVFLEPDAVARSLTEHHLLHGAGIAVARDELARIGGFHEDLRWYADLFATLQVALERGFVYLPGNAGFFRMNPDSFGNALSGRERHQDEVLAALLDRITAGSGPFKTRLAASGALGVFGPRLFTIAMAKDTRSNLLPLVERNRAQWNRLMDGRLASLSPLRRVIRDRLASVRSSLAALAPKLSSLEVWIYGAGSFAEEVLDLWSEFGFPRPKGFLLSNDARVPDPLSRSIHGLPVVRLGSLGRRFGGLVVLASKSYEPALFHNASSALPRARILSFYDTAFTKLARAKTERKHRGAASNPSTPGRGSSARPKAKPPARRTKAP